MSSFERMKTLHVKLWTCIEEC